MKDAPPELEKHSGRGNAFTQQIGNNSAQRQQYTAQNRPPQLAQF
jgi:hypothetical protein